MAIKIKIGRDDPEKKTKVKVSVPKVSPAELEAANKFAKEIALRKGLLSGENTHTGGVIPPFVDARSGRTLAPGESISPVGMLSNKVPAEIKSLEWDDKTNLPYYIDPKSGDSKYVAKELFYLPRFRRSNSVAPMSITESIVKR